MRQENNRLVLGRLCGTERMGRLEEVVRQDREVGRKRETEVRQ